MPNLRQRTDPHCDLCCSLLSEEDRRAAHPVPPGRLLTEGPSAGLIAYSGADPIAVALAAPIADSETIALLRRISHFLR